MRQSLWHHTHRQAAQRGSALVIALGIVLMVAVVGGSMAMVTHYSLQLTRQRNLALRTYYRAEGIVEQVHGEIDRHYRSGLVPDGWEVLDNMQPPEQNEFQLLAPDGGHGLNVATEGQPTFARLTGGSYQGLYAYRQKYVVDCTLSAAPRGLSLEQLQQQRFYTWATVSEKLHALAIPLVQFVAFYEDDLELTPHPPMVMEGRVHSNADMYINGQTYLEFSGGVSAVGDIYHGSLNSPSLQYNGDVMVRRPDGTLANMRNANGSWLDSRSPLWMQSALERWDGNVRSCDHRVPRLRLPIDLHEQPHQILERAAPTDSAQLASVKFENRADLKIIDGKGYDEFGHPVSLQYPDPADPTRMKSIIAEVERWWFDHREGVWTNAVQVDLANLRESGLIPDGGVLYIDQTEWETEPAVMDSVRLVNGDELPEDGLTVASPKPVYIKGDYNTINKKPALVAADAVSVLSNVWSDYNSEPHDAVTERQAVDTTVNTVLMTGKVSSIPHQRYSGGLENLPRFCENWDNQTMTFRGGMICMWESQTANGAWAYGDPVYTAPDRDWRYDLMYQDPGNNPPGLPPVYSLEVLAYQHAY